MSTHKFKVGDLVEVVGSGFTYPAYDTMFKKHGFRNEKVNPAFTNGTTAKVFAVEEQDDFDRNIYAIVDEHGNESLILESGLKLSEKFSRKTTQRISLSSDYEAIISKDGIKVGCQTISADKLKEIISAAKQVGLID